MLLVIHCSVQTHIFEVVAQPTGGDDDDDDEDGTLDSY